MTVLERFLEYVKFDTTSNPASDTVPSTPAQKEFGAYLVAEMQQIGIADAYIDEYGYVYGAVPSNIDKDVPTIGLIAHMDTSPAMSGKNINPRMIKNYDGQDIVLNEDLQILLSPGEFPNLHNYIGQDLIVTDGTTLLGADNKAGIAEILTAVANIIAQDLPHGTIKIGFTPDEEIGRGADEFNVADFAADYAYTVDGSTLGELEYENFNAAAATIYVQGKSIHPGTAKGQMKNAITMAIEFHNLLPGFKNPAFTEGYEGFIHLDEIRGETEKATLEYILRDHDAKMLEAQKVDLQNAADFINKKYGEGTIQIEVIDQYQNMAEKILPHMYIIDRAKEAMEQAGVEPITTPIRGGTDGARLSFMGLPCPNLCTGGENFHGKHEFASVQAMEKCVEILTYILCNAVKVKTKEHPIGCSFYI